MTLSLKSAQLTSCKCASTNLMLLICVDFISANESNEGGKKINGTKISIPTVSYSLLMRMLTQ